MKSPSHFQHLCLLSLLWWALLPLVGFVGDFPLNDDWAYAQNVYHLSQNNEIYFSDWPAMTLIAQTFWGAFFCKIFGFSFTVLRFSTLLMAWLGGCFGYLLLKRLGISGNQSLVAMLVWWFNPLFFSLAYTFMTDVHFLSISLIAAYCFVHQLQSPNHFSLLGIFVFTGWGVLIRQTGIFLPIAFLVASLIYKGFSFKNLVKAASPLVFAVLVLFFYNIWREYNYGLPPPYGNMGALFKGIFKGVLFANLKDRPAVLLFYLAYFLLPLLPLLLAAAWNRYSKKSFILVYASLLPLFFYWIFVQDVGRFLPIGNVFYNLGLGPKVLMDTHYEQNIQPIFSATAFSIFKIIGWLAAYILAGLLVLILAKVRYILGWQRAWVVGMSSAGLFCATYLLLDSYFFDRYFLGLHLFVFLAVLMLLSPSNIPKGWLIFSFVLILPWAWFGWAATHDYLAWNTSRWQALHYLTDSLQISPGRIDGGFEFNAWHQTHPERIKKPHSTDWWFVDKDDYVISFGAVRNYQPVKAYAYSAWLAGFASDSIFIMKKPIPSRIDSFFCDMEQVDSLGNFLSNHQGFVFAGGNHRDSSFARSGAYALRMGGDTQYALDLRLPVTKAYDEFILSAWVYDQETRWGGLHSHTILVGAAKKSEDFFHFTHYNIFNNKGWHYKEHRIVIPPEYPDSLLHLFVWQNDKDTVWVDDWLIQHVIY